MAEKIAFFGTIVRKEKKANEYLVEWEHTFLGKSTMAASLFLPTINLANKLRNKGEDKSGSFHSIQQC